MPRVVRPLALALALLLAPRAAAADAHTCQLGEAGVIEVDGARDDWRGFASARRGAAGDAQVELRCAYDDATLYLLVDVTDDRVLRTRQARPGGEDSVTISLRASSDASPLAMRVFPQTRAGARRLVGVPRGARVEDTLTERGYAVEVGIPLARLPGFGRSTPILIAEILAHDADRAATIEAIVGLRGRLHFSSHLPAYRGFLAATKLAAKDLRLDRLVDLDAAPGTERVVWGGRYLAVLSDDFGFVELPATGPEDVLAVDVVRPGGRPLILSHTRQRGANGARELLVLWRVDGQGRLARALALEVAQELDGRSIRDRWSFVPAGSSRPITRRPPRGALDLEVRVGEVLGWDAAAYAQVAPSSDVTPILTPFGGPSGVVYGFDGDAVIGPEPFGRARPPRPR